MKHKRLLEGLVFFLFIFWIYAAVIKLADISMWRFQLREQPFADALTDPLAFGLPALQFVIAALLISKKTLKWGLYSGALLLVIFSGYIALIKLNFFEHVPCSCAGIIRSFGWTEHLIFNIAILILTIIAIFQIKRPQSDLATLGVQLS